MIVMTTKEKVQEEWSQEALMGMGWAFMESRVFLTGVELDLFTLVAVEPLSAEQIAERIDADLRALTVVLDALTAMGLLIKQNGTYQTEPSAARLLSDSPFSILPMIRHSADLWDRWGQLTHQVAGSRVKEKSMQAFIGAMHIIGHSLAPHIVSLVGTSGTRRLLDVGGASGTYTIAFLEAEPQMRATLFDLPPVIEIARDRVGAAGMQDRITLVAGDYRKDQLPEGHDLAFVSAIIHQNSPAENMKMFRKIFAALEPGGRIVVRDHIMSADRTHPRSGALFAINMLLGTEGGTSYTETEIRDALEQAGFVDVRIIHPDTRMDGLMEGFKPR
jgi:predicted O-methyltransferase YrrM